jgi:hypothetical protein
MHFAEMPVAVVIVVISDHFIRFAFKAHAFTAASASDPVAPVDPVDGHVAGFVRALPDVVLLHVLLEEGIGVLSRLLARESRVIVLLALQAVRALARITLEVRSHYVVYLLTPCCEAEGHRFWVLPCKQVH